MRYPVGLILDETGEFQLTTRAAPFHLAETAEVDFRFWLTARAFEGAWILKMIANADMNKTGLLINRNTLWPFS